MLKFREIRRYRDALIDQSVRQMVFLCMQRYTSQVQILHSRIKSSERPYPLIYFYFNSSYGALMLRNQEIEVRSFFYLHIVFKVDILNFKINSLHMIQNKTFYLNITPSILNLLRFHTRIEHATDLFIILRGKRYYAKNQMTIQSIQY